MVFGFGDCLLDLERRELSRGGRPVALEPQVFDLLEYLIRNRQRVVSKDDLIASVWGGRIVSESALSTRINAARKAIGDDGTAQRLIKTLSRKGIRFIGTVREGQKAAQPAAEPIAPIPTGTSSAERRQLTVASCELLLGTAAGTGRMDPEDLHDVIGSYHRCVAETVGPFHGSVGQAVGRTVLVYFGYPVAHEDEVEQAVRAGLELCAAIGRLEPRREVRLQARVGIATGQVVVGDPDGAATGDRTLVGESPSIAARLQSAAQPGTVLIDAETRQLVGSLFGCGDVDPINISGSTEMLPAWQALRASAIESRFEARHSRALTPMVGREEEMELLLRRWARARSGEGSVVLLSGEPGIGKSRIAETLLERLRGEPHACLRYFCSPRHQDSALHPSIKELERAAGFHRDDTDEQKLTKLEAALALSTDDLREAVPLAADLLSVPTGERYPALNVTPQQRKEKALRAQLARIEGLAARRPLLILYEDIQWTDPTTRESLDLLIDRVPALSALVIMSFRPEFTPSWVGRPHVTLLTLSRLPRRQSNEMILHVTGGKALPKEIAEQIAERTDGVPLFIEELTKAVVESGQLLDSGDRYSVTGPASALTIPTSLQASLLARLDRLASARDVVQIAAALGRSFPHKLLSDVSGMPEQFLAEALAQLTQAELIYRRGTPPDAEYTFKHALVRDAAYGTMLRQRRQELHTRIVATLEEQFPEIVASQPELLAQHAVEAGLVEKAVAYWLKAGRQEHWLGRSVEAAAQLRKGLALLAGQPDSPWRRQQEFDLQIALQRALATKGFSSLDLGESIARARALAEQIDRPEYLVRLCLSQFGFHASRAEHRLALTLAEQIEKIGDARNDAATRLLGRRVQGLTLCYSGEFIAARARLDQCHDLSDPANRAEGAASEDPYAVMLVYLAVTLANLGYVEDARSRLNQALSEARRLKHAQTLAAVLIFGNWVELTIRSPEIEQHAEELSLLATEHGFSVYLAWATIIRGSSLAQRGHAREGLALIIQGRAALRATGTVSNTPIALVMLADTYARLGEPAEALNSLAEAVQMIEATGERSSEAEVYRLRGDLQIAANDSPAAETSYRRALEVAKRQSAKLFELRSAVHLARLWCKQDKRREARDLLLPVYGWFSAGLDSPDVSEAKALLDSL